MSRYNSRTTSRLSRVQQIQAEEEKMQKQAIRDHNRQAYIARAQRRNQRKVPAWVRERDAQRRSDDAKKMEAGEFVIHVGNRSRRNRSRRPSLADVPKQETKVVPTTSRWAALASDSDEEDIREEFPQLTAPTKKLLTPLGNWAAAAAKVVPEKPPQLERQCADEGAFRQTHRESFKRTRPTSIKTPKVHFERPEEDNSAWSDDEDTAFEVVSFKKDPSCYNADGTMKSWADLCDEDSSDDEEW